MLLTKIAMINAPVVSPFHAAVYAPLALVVTEEHQTLGLVWGAAMMRMMEKTMKETTDRFFCLFCALGLICTSACQPTGPHYRIVKSSFMEFENLFTPIDTIRFDASNLIGTIDVVDRSGRGDFLITDGVMRGFHVFNASGRHLHTFNASRCNPEDNGRPRSAKFLKDDSIIVTTTQGTYAFNANGSCNKRLTEIVPVQESFCERQDTIYFLSPRLQPPQINAYSIGSSVVRKYNLRMPAFPLATSVKRGYLGRQIACFNQEGVFYRYAESSDGEPLWPGNDPVLHEPIHYRPPERDAKSEGMNNLAYELLDLAREFTYSDGIFELDEEHRIVTFERSPKANINIVHMGTQTSVSTANDLYLLLAKDQRFPLSHNSL